MSTPLKDVKIAVIGLGYVGLPLAVEFAKKFPVIGFDIASKRVKELNDGHDFTLEVEDHDLKAVLAKSSPKEKGLYNSENPADLSDCQVYIF